MWIAANELPRTGGHPFYLRLNQVLDAHAFDEFVEAQCAPFYAETVGRPSLTPGTYFRLLLIGYFEGIDSERGIAWRTADSLALRGFLGLGLDETPPEHSTISRTRRLIDVETHRTVFTWILQVLATQAAGVPTRFLHDCRRTAARNLIRANIPERVAMLLTGHKSRAIFDRYNIIHEQELLGAGDQLVAYLAQQAQATPRGGRPHPAGPAAPRPAPALRLVRRTTA